MLPIALLLAVPMVSQDDPTPQACRAAADTVAIYIDILRPEVEKAGKDSSMAASYARMVGEDQPRVDLIKRRWPDAEPSQEEIATFRAMAPTDKKAKLRLCAEKAG